MLAGGIVFQPLVHQKYSCVGILPGDPPGDRISRVRQGDRHPTARMVVCVPLDRVIGTYPAWRVSVLVQQAHERHDRLVFLRISVLLRFFYWWILLPELSRVLQVLPSPVLHQRLQVDRLFPWLLPTAGLSPTLLRSVLGPFIPYFPACRCGSYGIHNRRAFRVLVFLVQVHAYAGQSQDWKIRFDRKFPGAF